MSSDPTRIDLTHFDALRPANLDPTVWSANLAALQGQNPGLSDELARVALPDHWRPALALDDFVTYRIEPPGAPPTWLGGTAAPLARARSLIAKLDPSGKNPALPTCGSGAEIVMLLERLPAHRAVFVMENDTRALAAVLRVQNLAAALNSHRCILVPPEREYAFLTQLLERHPGLLSPGEILLPFLVPAARVAALRTLGEDVLRTITQQRAGRLRELAAAPRPPARALPDRPRVAVISLTTYAPTQNVAEHITRAARQLGWPVLLSAVTDPLHAHALAHCEALAAFQPDLTVCVNHPRSHLPIAAPGVTYVWQLDAPTRPDELLANDTQYLAASPTIARALADAGVAPERIHPWYWACSPPPADTSSDTPDDAVVIAADLPDATPTSCGIEQHAHLMLWEHLGQQVTRRWQEARVLDAQGLLATAERDCHYPITDDKLRAAFVRLIAQVLIPATIAAQTAAAAARSAPVYTWGHGWQRPSGGQFKSLATHLRADPVIPPGWRPRACVLAGQPDPLHPAALHAAARGWPLLVHAAGGRMPASAFGDVLHPGEHFETFADLGTLRQRLEFLRSSAASPRALRARQHVADKHIYARRWQELLACARGA
ncbi:MAG: glycosyltransferase family 1 protein [Phycisphaerae bacterium]|nr:glycosyltransferase family 1 protein [Phycisphaerae bacterium]